MTLRRFCAPSFARTLGRKTGLALAGALSLGSTLSALGLRPETLELGSTFLERKKQGLVLRELDPATRALSQPEARIRSGSTRFIPQGKDQSFRLIRCRHFDLGEVLARFGTILAQEGGRWIVRFDPAGRRAFEAWQETSEEGHHSEDFELPWGEVLSRDWQREEPPFQAWDELVQILGELEIARWQADVNTLVGFQTRHSSHAKIWEVANWLQARFESLGIPSQIQKFKTWSFEAPNVIAKLFAPEGQADRPIVVIGAHFDSISFGSKDKAPGADDNASGTAAVLELGRFLAKIPDPGFEIHLALFSGEEQGLYGSKDLVKKMQAEGTLSRVVEMVNLDMMAFDTQGPLNVTLETKSFNQDGLDRWKALAEAYTELQVRTTTRAWGSDHVPFLDKGVKAMLPIEGEYDGNPHDHTPHDVVANLNPQLAKQILRLVASAVLDRALQGRE